MKIQHFCAKIRDDKGSIFQALRSLQKVDTQTLLDTDGTLSWDPWTRLAAAEPASA